MESVSLFSLASRQAEWLSVRQSAISGNIANANTPGYRSVDVQPFEGLLNKKPVTLVSTQPGHIRPAASQTSFDISEIEPNGPAMPSENTVTLEDELIKSAGGVFEIMRDGTLVFPKKKLDRFPTEQEVERMGPG